jgi:hypothetical protein
MAMCLPFLLAGCASQSEAVIRTVVVAPAIPDEAKKPCIPKISRPQRDLTRAEVASLWRKDRANLSVCEARHSAILKALEVKQ